MNYIKTLILIGLCTGASLAHADCAQTAGEHAFAIARPNGNDPQSEVFASIGDIKLLKKKGQHLSYEVQIIFEFNDGASSGDFPPEVYLVSAKGTEKSCKVTGVQLQKF